MVYDIHMVAAVVSGFIAVVADRRAIRASSDGINKVCLFAAFCARARAVLFDIHIILHFAAFDVFFKKDRGIRDGTEADTPLRPCF